MSGPKSSRYTLTPEQRKILREARERERKTQLELKRNKNYKSDLEYASKSIGELLSDIDVLVERTRQAKDEQSVLLSLRSETLKQISKLNSVATEKVLEDLQEQNEKTVGMIKDCQKVIGSIRKKHSFYREQLQESVTDSIAQGMNIRFEDEITVEPTYLQKKKQEIEEVLKDVDIEVLDAKLRQEYQQILFKIHQITNDDFIDNFYAMSVTPYLKRCNQYRELVQVHGANYEELIEEYAFLCENLGMEMNTAYSIYEMQELEQVVAELRLQYEKIEEQKYISECLEEVMSDMGYILVGEREVTKKSGKKFRNELFEFSEGTVVNVTYSVNGQISMELGGIDTCSREPSKEESSALCEDMEQFCAGFTEIEKRLLEKGVIMASRISLLPSSEEYAQIIDISNYEMNQTVRNFEHSSRSNRKQQKAMTRKE